MSKASIEFLELSGFVRIFENFGPISSDMFGSNLDGFIGELLLNIIESVGFVTVGGIYVFEESLLDPPPPPPPPPPPEEPPPEVEGDPHEDKIKSNFCDSP